MKTSHYVRSLACLSALALGANARAQDEWLRHFRVGMSFGMNISTDFKTAGTFPVGGAAPGPAPAAGNADRIYDDGYVRVDETGNAIRDGQTAPSTTFWGYQRADQLVGDTLTYRGSRSFTGQGGDRVQDAPNLGFDMAYGGSIVKWDRVAIGAEFGFNLTSISTKDLKPLAANVEQVIDTYRTGGTTVPPAPYSGPFATPGPDDPGYPAPVINSIPTGRTIVTLPGTITGERRLEAILYQFRLGPIIRWQFQPRWVLNGSLGAAGGLFDGAYKFNERVGLGNGSFTSNNGEFSDMKFVYGGYAGAVVTFDSGHYWDAFLGAHFVSMSDATIGRSGREAHVNLGGALYLSVGINWTF